MGEQGVIFRVGGSDMAEHLRELAEYHGSFTAVVEAFGWNGKGEEPVLLCLGRDKIGWLGLVRRSGRVATQIDRLSFTHLRPLVEPLSLQDIIEGIPPRYRDHLQPYLRGSGGRLPPGTWREVVHVLERRRPESRDLLAYLRTRLASPKQWVLGHAGGVVAQEKDAVNLALRAAGMSTAHLAEWMPGESPAPFLDGVQSSYLREDQQIEHDAQVFGSWSVIARYQAGARVFVDPETEKRLTVVNVNRTPVEATLGVDLVYYNHAYLSYVGVQYKRMERDGGESSVGYRPTGKTYEAEVERMQAFEAMYPAGGWDGLLDRYRLHGGVFYFKLCPKVIPEPLSESMLKGMYIPVDYWVRLVNDPSTRGPHGGTRVTYENVGRYLYNTLFVQLLSAGWIGSRDVATTAISKIIRAGVEEGRSVLLAAAYPAASRDAERPA